MQSVKFQQIHVIFLVIKMVLNNKKAMAAQAILILVVIVAMIIILGKYIGNADNNLDASMRCENNPVGIEGVCADSPPEGYNPDPLYEGKSAIQAGCSSGENCYRKFGQGEYVKLSKKAELFNDIKYIIIALVVIAVAVVIIIKLTNNSIETVADQFKCQNQNPKGFCIDKSSARGCEQYDATAKDSGFYKYACYDSENKETTKDLVCCILNSGKEPIDLITFHVEGWSSTLKDNARIDMSEYSELKLSVMVPEGIYDYNNLIVSITKRDAEGKDSPVIDKTNCTPKTNDEKEKVAFSTCGSMILAEGRYELELTGFKGTDELFNKVLVFYAFDSTSES